MTLTISGSGTAFNITDQSIHQTASLDLTVKVERVSFGRALVTVTGGTLRIGSDTWTVEHGRGIVNFHSGRVLLHVSMRDGNGKPAHLVLFGKTSGISSTIGVGATISVDLRKPQSKLAGKWFLEFPSATITRTS